MDDTPQNPPTSVQKDPQKGTAPNNYRLITSLPMTWKIITAQIREEIYYSLINRRLFPEEQKGCLKGQEEQKIYCALINTSSTKSERDEKMWLWSKFTIKGHTI